MAETPGKLRFLKLSPEAEAAQQEQDEPGSTPLVSFKAERFCHFLMKGISPTKAYEKAGYEGTSAGNATRLINSPSVAARLRWLNEEAARFAVVDSGYVKRRLKDVVDLSLSTEINDDGELSPGPTFSLPAANRALELLGKDLGMFKERIELGGHVQVANAELFRKLTPDERTQMRAMLVEAAARLPVPANQNAEGEQDGDDVAPVADAQ